MKASWALGCFAVAVDCVVDTFNPASPLWWAILSGIAAVAFVWSGINAMRQPVDWF